MNAPIRIGGLMRCCIESLERNAPDDAPEGTAFRCLWCSDEAGMIFRDGVWQWAVDR